MESSSSLKYTAPLAGRGEAYVLDDAPVAFSMGQIVNSGYPLIWMPGEKPFHVTNSKKLKVICPMRFRFYADHVNENVPFFKEEVTFGSHGTKNQSRQHGPTCGPQDGA